MNVEKKKTFLQWLVHCNYLSPEHAAQAMNASVSTEGDILRLLAKHELLQVPVGVAWNAWTLYCNQQVTSVQQPAVSPEAKTLKENRRQTDRLAKAKSNQVLGGRYLLGAELGRGGMGIVYRATDQRLKREVAIKVIRSETGVLPEEDVTELVAEARTMAEFTHPNVIGVLDIAQENGVPYIVMEFIEGTTLGGACEPYFSEMKPGVNQVSEGEAALKVMVQYIAGVAEIHRLSRVHRDLKPDNGLVDSRGTAKVMDFGLAVQADKPASTFGGSPAWMSPEQVMQIDSASDESIPSLALSCASDVYTLGRMLYWSLTGGEMLHEGKSLPAIYMRIIEHADRSAVVRAELKELGYDYLLIDIVARCVHEKAEERFSTAIELLEALEARTKTLAQAKWKKVFRRIGLVSLALIALASSFGAWSAYRASQAYEREAETATALASANLEKARTAEALLAERAASLQAVEDRNLVSKHAALARVHQQYYRWQACIEELTKALEVYPKEKHAQHADLLGPLLMQRGHAYFHLRDTESIKDMDAAAESLAEPLRSEALFWALVFEATLDHRAQVHPERLEKIESKHYQNLLKVFLATIPETQEERVRIRAENLRLLETIEESERSSVWHFIYAHTLSQPATEANTVAAIRSFDESIRQDPYFGLSYYNRAVLLVRLSLFRFEEMKKVGVNNPHLVKSFLGYQERAVSDYRMLFRLMPDWFVAKMNFAESVCAIVHFGTLKKSGSGPAVQLLEEALSMIRPLWAKSDEELGEDRFKTGYRLLELLLVKHGVCRRLGLPSREVNTEAHQVWNRLSRTPFTDEQRAKLAGAKQTFGFD